MGGWLVRAALAGALLLVCAGTTWAAPNGTSFDQMVAYQQQAAAIVARDPAVGGYMSSVGSGGSTTGTNSGRIFMTLKPLHPGFLFAGYIATLLALPVGLLFERGR